MDFDNSDVKPLRAYLICSELGVRVVDFRFRGFKVESLGLRE